MTIYNGTAAPVPAEHRPDPAPPGQEPAGPGCSSSAAWRMPGLGVLDDEDHGQRERGDQALVLRVRFPLASS
jgi:hypothetical protein